MKLKKTIALLAITLALTACAAKPTDSKQAEDNSKDKTETKASNQSESSEDADYHIVELNVEFGDELYYWATNTDVSNLGELLASEDTTENFFEIKKKGDKHYVASYRGKKSNEDEMWIIVNTKYDGTVEVIKDPYDVDIKKDLNFNVLYGDPDTIKLNQE